MRGREGEDENEREADLIEKKEESVSSGFKMLLF